MITEDKSEREMKFTDSPVIELPVRQSVLSLQQDNASMHVGTSVWPCSLVLVKFIERWAPLSNSSSNPNPNPYLDLLDFRSKRAVEIGAGCGVAGMGLFLLGLSDIVLTDIAPVMPALKRNLKVNKSVLGRNLKYMTMYWNDLEKIRGMNLPFDFVIATDVVYIEESVSDLVRAMEILVGENGVVLLGYQVRCPDADKRFWEMCGEVFVVDKVPHEHLHPEYAYEETNVYVMRKKRKQS